ncbi:LLP -like protein [Brachionus plicatilis]|uniref:LLP-like protein n=1 Tax=Brachionus plicatilis TaxID=10195 RepID=A0A3M7SVU7_BRAPC|nr:LLP -like protein [Brachionus plicatilis]
MAKSERKSKWKRKFRAIKREKNKKKELMMLNSVIEKRSESASEVMSTEAPVQEDESMQVVGEQKVYNSRTKLDKNGNYPGWMNQRAIKKIKKIKKRLNSKK